MSNSLWDSTDLAAAVLGRIDDTRALPAPGDLAARPYFDALCREGKLVDAISFLAHLLPRREVVWWGCLCLWRVSRPAPAAEADGAFAAVARWVLDPSEAHCRAAGTAADAAGDGAPSFLARAVAFCGTSMTPPGLPVVPPPPYLPHRAVAGALELAAAGDGDDHLREFLAWGVDVADGKNRWS